VAHELIHFQQPGPGLDPTLLEQSIHEGAADFVAELISGRHINDHVHVYALPREATLWTEFEPVMHGHDYGGWLYGGQSEGRPADIGYFFGYQIARSYYEQAADKRSALRDILLVDDYGWLLAASGYDPSGP
jgi:uncharacterized protein YjaZ